MTKNNGPLMTCTKSLRWCSGHRVLGHENVCGHPHGHNYRAEVTCRQAALSKPLDHLGRVVDFSVIKTELGEWIDTNWDHAFIMFSDDAELVGLFANRPWRRWESALNPTAENLAQILMTIGDELLAPYGIVVQRVTVHETDTCYATVTKGRA